jgi:hypothetical protein
MANQFTKGTRKRHDEQTIDKIRAEALAKRLFKFAKAKSNKRKDLDMSPAQVAAAKVLIERGKPALQSIEQRITEEPVTEEQLMAQMHSLLADPTIRAQLKAHLEGLDQPANDDVQAQQSSKDDSLAA